MKSRTHRKRKNRRNQRLYELIAYNQIRGKRFRSRWRINDSFDYWPGTGRVLDRRDPSYWRTGRVSGPDELVMVVRGALQLKVTRVTRRANPWEAPWRRSKPSPPPTRAGRSISDVPISPGGHFAPASQMTTVVSVYQTTETSGSRSGGEGGRSSGPRRIPGRRRGP